MNLIDRKAILDMLDATANENEAVRRPDETDLDYRRRTAMANAARTLIRNVEALPSFDAGTLLKRWRIGADRADRYVAGADEDAPDKEIASGVAMTLRACADELDPVKQNPATLLPAFIPPLDGVSDHD